MKVDKCESCAELLKLIHLRKCLFIVTTFDNDGFVFILEIISSFQFYDKLTAFIVIVSYFTCRIPL